MNTEEDFYNKYELETNTIQENASFDGKMFETYGEELDYVKSCIDSKRVWTIIDTNDGGLYYCAGFHWVNRLGYLISTKPWTDEFEEYTAEESTEDEEERTDGEIEEDNIEPDIKSQL